MRKLILATALLMGSSAAFAQFTGETAAHSDAASIDTKKITTVEEALTLKDDTKVTLEGSIVKHLGGEHYLFKDATGEVSIEIDHKDWRGVEVGPEDTVIIEGEVDHHRHRATDIEVNRIFKK